MTVVMAVVVMVVAMAVAMAVVVVTVVVVMVIDVGTFSGRCGEGIRVDDFTFLRAHLETKKNIRSFKNFKFLTNFFKFLYALNFTKCHKFCGWDYSLLNFKEF